MKLACVFPGQGSQSVGMLNGFAERPEVQALIETADRALAESLSRLIAEGPADVLGQTVHTQPAMVLAGIACYTAWRQAGGPEPVVFAGHSLGEYTALTAAGAFDFDQALRLVRIRAQAMQEAVPLGSGTMAAILGLDDDSVRAACREACDELAGRTPATPGVAEIVEPVNWNAPAQVVIAGSTAAVASACEIAKQKGAKRAVPLAVSAPFHASLLRPAGERLAEALRASPPRAPLYPVINNVDVAMASTSEAVIDALVRQVYSPVRWVELVRQMVVMGVTDVIEFGPGKVLSGLVKRIAPELKVASVFDAASLESVRAECV